METVLLHFNHRQARVYIGDQAAKSVLNEIFKFREYRIAESVIQEAIDPIVDVGAHRGFFSLYCRMLNSQVPLIALEPEPANLALLHQHVMENNLLNIQIVEAALAGKTGPRMLGVSTDSHNHSLVVNSKTTLEKRIKVNAYSLKDIFSKFKLASVSVLKMDIEGGEYEIFETTTSGELSKIKHLLMEYHTVGKKTYQLIEDKLRKTGFGVQIFPSQFAKTMGFLWATNKRKTVRLS